MVSVPDRRVVKEAIQCYMAGGQEGVGCVRTLCQQPSNSMPLYILHGNRYSQHSLSPLAWCSASFGNLHQHMAGQI